MSDQLKEADFVEHSTLGVGKVVYVDSAKVRIYFKNKAGDRPED